MAQSAAIDAAIRRYEGLIQWFDRNLDGLAMSDTLRARLAAGCCYAAMDHQKAIVLLVANKVVSSAYSLVRPLHDAYIRGVWLWECASDADLEDFRRDKTPGIAPMLKAVESVPAYDAGTLSSLKSFLSRAMNSYTHTGFQHVVRLMTAESIEPAYEEAEVLEMLLLANLLGALAAVATANIAGDLSLATAILQRIRVDFGQLQGERS